MGRLFDEIQTLVAADQFIVGALALDRLAGRKVLEWQIADGLREGELLAERARTLPRPSIEVRQTLADGTPVKVIWSLVSSPRLAFLVTVHFFDR